MFTNNISHYLANNFGVPLEAIEIDGSHFSCKKIKKGTFLLKAGEICNETFFVEEGLLRMFSLDSAGREHIIQFAPENWLITDRSSSYFNEKSEYYIEAIEESVVWFLKEYFFNDIHKSFPESSDKTNVLLQKHIKTLQNRINSLLTDTAEERYLKFMKLYPDLMMRVPQWMVASYLGITPESLSRVRKELVRKKTQWILKSP